jgi:DNA-binding MarR family transcriptional regulator
MRNHEILLDYIRTHNGTEQRELGPALGFQKSYLTELLQKLEAEQKIVRRVDSAKPDGKGGLTYLKRIFLTDIAKKCDFCARDVGIHRLGIENTTRNLCSACKTTVDSVLALFGLRSVDHSAHRISVSSEDLLAIRKARLEELQQQREGFR